MAAETAAGSRRVEGGMATETAAGAHRVVSFAVRRTAVSPADHESASPRAVRLEIPAAPTKHNSCSSSTSQLSSKSSASSHGKKRRIVSLKELMSDELTHAVREDHRHFNLDRECEFPAFPHQSPLVLSPLAEWRLNWDIGMMLLIIYVMIVTPFELAFVVSRPFKRQFASRTWSTGVPAFNRRSGLWLANLLVNCGFLVDMYLNFVTAYFDRETCVWRTGHAAIAARYLKSWFFLDLLSILPMEYVAGEEALLVRLLRLFRLAKLLKVLQSPRLIARMTKHVDLSTKLQTVIKYCAVLLVLVHWSACALRVVTDFNLGDCEPSAGRDPTTSEPCPVTVLTRNRNWGDGLWAVYLEACNWALIALNGEAVGQTHAELTLGLVVMLTGIVILAFLIGDLSNIMSNLDPVKNEFTKTLDSLNDYMHASGFPSGLRLKLREYILMSEPVYRDSYNKDMLSKLSPTLMAIVARQNLGKVVNCIPFYTYTIQSVLGHRVGTKVSLIDDDAFASTSDHLAGRPVTVIRTAGFLRYDVRRDDDDDGDDRETILRDIPHSRLIDAARDRDVVDRGIRINYQRDLFVASVARLFETRLFMAWDDVIHRNLSLNDSLFVIHTGKILLLGYDLKKPYGIAIKQAHDFFGGDIALVAVRDGKNVTRPYSAHATQMTQVFALDATELYELLQHPSLSYFLHHFRLYGYWLIIQRQILKVLARHGTLRNVQPDSLLFRHSLDVRRPALEDSQSDDDDDDDDDNGRVALDDRDDRDDVLRQNDTANLLSLASDILTHGFAPHESRSTLATPRVLHLARRLVLAMREDEAP